MHYAQICHLYLWGCQLYERCKAALHSDFKTSGSFWQVPIGILSFKSIVHGILVVILPTAFVWRTKHWSKGSDDSCYLYSFVPYRRSLWKEPGFCVPDVLWASSFLPSSPEVYSCQIFSLFLTVAVVPIIPLAVRMGSFQTQRKILCNAHHGSQYWCPVLLPVTDLMCCTRGVNFSPYFISQVVSDT